MSKLRKITDLTTAKALNEPQRQSYTIMHTSEVLKELEAFNMHVRREMARPVADIAMYRASNKVLASHITLFEN